MSSLNPSLEIRERVQLGLDPDLLRSDDIKVAALVSYVGTNYAGFAYQKGQRTIAGDLLDAMDKCLGDRPKLTVAGRTDAGVHARGQVISFSVSQSIGFEASRFIKSMNSLLCNDISIRSSWIAEQEFNARFSARWRKYRYRYSFQPTKDPFSDPFCWRVNQNISIDKMIAGSLHLIGEHDFSSFCRKDPNGRSLTRRIDSINFEKGEDFLDLWITASSFCHQMVRSIAGLLYQVGISKSDPGYVITALNRHDRSSVQLLAPPSGLCLWEVGYGSD